MLCCAGTLLLRGIMLFPAMFPAMFPTMFPTIVLVFPVITPEFGWSPWW